MASERPVAVPLTDEEERELRNQEQGEVRVNAGEEFQDQTAFERLVRGIPRGATLGLINPEEVPEEGFWGRVPRVAGETLGAEALTLGALYGASRLPAPGGIRGIIPRLGRGVIDALRERPGRAGVAIAGGTTGAVAGGAGLPELWDSQYAEPVGSIIGGGVGNLATSAGTSLLGRTGLIERALNRPERTATEILTGQASDPVNLRPENIRAGATGMADRVEEATGVNPGITLSQATQDAGIAGVERETGRGQGVIPQSVRPIREDQRRAISEAAFPTEGRVPITEGTAAADIEAGLRDSLATATSNFTRARDAVPATPVPASPLFTAVNNIYANRDAAENVNQTIPAVARNLYRAIQNGSIGGQNGAISARTLVGMRNELQTQISRAGADPALRERAEIMIRAIDEALEGSNEVAPAFRSFRAAEDDLNYVRDAAGRSGRVLERSVSDPESFRSLLRITGDQSQAVQSARNVIQNRLENFVSSRGEVNGAALRDFLADRRNAALIREAFGTEHYNRLQRLSRIASDLATERLIPPGASQGVAREVTNRAEGQRRVLEQVVPAPLNPYTPLGFVRKGVREMMRSMGMSQQEATYRVLADALSDPDYAARIFSRGQVNRAERAGRRVSNIGARALEPAAEQRDISQNQGEEAPGLFDDITGAARSAYDQARRLRIEPR